MAGLEKENINYVSREEFNALQDKVEAIERDMEDSKKLLHAIDTKLNVIIEKVNNNTEKENLLLEPVKLRVNNIEQRISKVEEGNTWAWRSIAVAILGHVINLMYNVSKIM